MTARIKELEQAVDKQKMNETNESSPFVDQVGELIVDPFEKYDEAE